MGISLNKLNEKGMRCPMMGGIECIGDSCMLWRWDNDGLPHYEFYVQHDEMSGEWIKDGDPLEDAVGVFVQRWKHPPTGYCGLVKE